MRSMFTSTSISHLILFSGLSDKTKLSFSSSNSSFLECTRKHDTHYLLSNGECNPSQSSYQDNQEMERLSCSTTDGDYSFSNCRWSICSYASNASCIYLVNSSSSLTVDKCSFTDCKANAGCGGAIYGYNINRVNVMQSSFLRCNILSSSHSEHGGGGMYLEYVTDEVIIQSSSFIDSSVPHDSGGVDMWYCSCTSGHTNTFQDCKFIECVGVDNDGGGIMAWETTYNVGIINTLFASCSSYLGGGIRIYIPFVGSCESIAFCFFDNNSGTWGHDICTTPKLSTSPFIHCFSTKNEKNHGYWMPGVYSWYSPPDTDWLPHVKDNRNGLLHYHLILLQSSHSISV